MKFFDSHSHIDDQSFEKDVDETLKRAKEAGVSEIMIVGTNKETSKKAIKIAKSGPGLYASVGIHPHDAKDCDGNVIEVLKKLAKNSQVRAWGETGLDFNRMRSPASEQIKCFERQLEAASELKLPLIFHERDSKGRFLEILKTSFNSGNGGVVHCFSGDRFELEEYVKIGLYIGITGILTIKKRGEKLRQLAPLIPASRILIETDAPYLTPAPQKNRTRRNEPAFVKSILYKLADVLNKDAEELARIVRKNTLELYKVKIQGDAQK